MADIVYYAAASSPRRCGSPDKLMPSRCQAYPDGAVMLWYRKAA